MNKSIPIASGVLTLLLLINSCSSYDSTSEIDELMNQLVEKGDFNGAILVTENDQVIYGQGFGYADFEQQVPFETSTTMDAGSMAKTFTAYSTQLLAQEDQLSLSDPVKNHIDSFPYPGIEIHHLLRHTSGLVSDDFVYDQAVEGKVLTNDFFVQALIDSVPPLSYEPGSRFQYNGLNYILLAQIIEKVSGNSYDEFIRSRIAGSLDMNDWFLRPARLKDWQKTRTKGYGFQGDSLILSDSEDYEGIYGDCNLFFSAEDLSKWSQSFYSDAFVQNEALNGLLNSKDTVSFLNDLHWYDLGQKGQYHFTGHWRGFYTMVYFDIEQKRSIVYLSNTSMEYWLRPLLVHTIVSILNGNKAPLIAPEAVQPPTEYLNTSYEVSDYGLVGLSQTNEYLLSLQINSNSYDMYDIGNGYYYAPGVDAWVWFTIKADTYVMHWVDIYGDHLGMIQ